MFRLVLQLFDTTKKFSLSDIQDFRRLSKSNNCLASQPLSPTIRHPPFSTTRHAHSILSMYRNALIYKRKIFLLTVETPTAEPSKFSAFDFKGEFARFDFSAVSATIDNDWSIFSRTVPNRARPANSKRPSRRFYHTSAPPNRGSTAVNSACRHLGAKSPTNLGRAGTSRKENPQVGELQDRTRRCHE